MKKTFGNVFVQSALKSAFFMFLLIGALVALIVTSATAQNRISSQSLEVSPPSQELQSQPGSVTVVTAKVRNKSTQTIPVKVRIEDFTASGDEGQVALTTKSDYSLTSWTTITPSSFSLAPGEEKEVTAQIKTPANAAGGRYGSFVFSVVGPQRENEATVGQEIASLFLVKITGPVNENLVLSEFSVPGFSEFGPIPFALKFTNGGNIHTKAFGLINVTDMFGQKVADIVVTGANIFPNASRILKSELPNKFLAGRYTATAIMYYGSIKNQTLTATTSFIVFPVRLVLVIVAIAAILYISRKRIRKALKALFK